ncbi:MAG: penicillin-binding protein activator [Thiohalocapsa sp.]|nr:penicillin-binding protein activator [Thiohalocapsa sp.]MCF7988969.1 penicillin-binding protein activator [Thiohalocapsa sp.]
MPQQTYSFQASGTGDTPLCGAAPALFGLLLALLLAGCTIDPVRDEQRVLADVPAAPLGKARGLEQSGEPEKAAEAYLALAEDAVSPAKEQLRLNAAEALLQAGKPADADRVLAEIGRGSLTSSQRELVLMLEAEVALQRGRAGEAIAKLDRVNKSALPSDLKARYLGTQAAAYRLNGQPLAAAERLDELDKLLTNDPAARLDNQVSLLFTLSTLGRGGLAEAERTSRGRMQGWVELARLFSGHGAKTPQLDADFRKWRSGRGGHPALPGLSEAYYNTLAGGYPAGMEVLVLLPTGGRFGVAGEAIKDGVQAAYDADRSGQRPQLQFRNSTGSVGSAFDRGVDGGSDLVLGPLEKSSVGELARRSSLPVPTLALNRTGGAATENLYQFSLAPEDEAINVANYAHASGLRSAALLYPQGPWGERMRDAFRTQWRSLGGKVAGQRAYPPGDSSYGVSANALLSAGDADFVFLVSGVQDAVPLYGSLREADARMPVVATSHVYDGDFNPTRDAALSGLYLVDIPWILDTERSDALSRKALRDKLPNVNGPLARLYAMGIDGYRLAPRIADMGNSPGIFFPGETGGLNVDSLGQVRRQLVLAKFTPSGPEVADTIEAESASSAAPDAGAPQ